MTLMPLLVLQYYMWVIHNVNFEVLADFALKAACFSIKEQSIKYLLHKSANRHAKSFAGL